MRVLEIKRGDSIQSLSRGPSAVPLRLPPTYNLFSATLSPFANLNRAAHSLTCLTREGMLRLPLVASHART